MRTLKKGSKGTEVRMWQKFLTEQGLEPGAVDGNFGPKTHKATVAFQKEHGLETDGMVGKKTFTKAAELGYDYKPPKTGSEYTNELKQEYKELFDSCAIKSNKKSGVDKIVNDILKNIDRYKDVSIPFGIPWQFVAVIHNMESSLNFNTHLHNGDSLQRRTVHVPAGRPKTGSPPFTWEESAADALIFKEFDKWKDWSMPGMLYNLEKYNGWGYRNSHPHVLSPYLWSFTNHYTSGKYIADSKWSDTAVSKQCGAAALLKKLYKEEVVTPVIVKEDTKFISPEEVPNKKQMKTGEKIYKLACKHEGEEYILGAFAPKNNSNWEGPWDCAEFVSWCVYQISGILYGCTNNNVDPAIADGYTGSWGRDAKKIGKKISTKKAAGIKGAAVLRSPAGRVGHIVISDGNGGTIEAHSSKRGVIKHTLSRRRWDMGILVPGIKYSENGEIELEPPMGIVYRLEHPMMSGAGIKSLQRALKEKGFDPGKIDGLFGNKTYAAVVAFQASKGIVVDGEAGPITQKALGI